MSTLEVTGLDGFMEKYFSDAFYLQTYADIKESEVNSVEHFREFGLDENRLPNPLLNLDYAQVHTDGALLNWQTEEAIEIFAKIKCGDLFSTHPLVCPAWIASQSKVKPDPNSPFFDWFHGEFHTFSTLSLHPCFKPIEVDVGFEEFCIKLLTNGELLTELSIIDFQEYTRQHRDIRTSDWNNLSIINHLWQQGFLENRLKYLGSSSPRWATKDYTILLNFIVILRSYLKGRIVLTDEKLSRINLCPNVFRWPYKSSVKQVLKPAIANGLSLPDVSEVFALLHCANATSEEVFIEADHVAAPTIIESKHRREIKDIDLFAGRDTSLPESPRVVYCVNIGGYDDFPIPPNVKDASHYLITDAPIDQIDGDWTVVRPTLAERDVKRLCLWYKTHPHVLFPWHPFSIWIDSNVDCLFGSDRIIAAHELMSEVATFKHPDRNCVYDEAEAIIDLNLDAKSIVQSSIEKLRDEGFPEQHGLYETNVLLCRTSDWAVRDFLDTWWKRIYLGSRRDQMSFSYSAWRNGIEISPLDGKSNTKNSRYFSKRDHKNPSGRMSK